MPIINPDFNTIVNAIAENFGTSTSNVINTLNKQNVTTAQEAFKLLEDTSYEKWYTFDGKISGVNIPSWGNTVVDSVAGELNSNLQNTAQFNYSTPISGNVASGSGNIFSAGAKILNSDIPVDTVASKLAVGVTAVNIGAKLGKFIDQTLYNTNPSFWDEVAPAINPQTWDTIAGDSKWGQATINWLFGIDNEKNEITPYVPEDAFAYFALMMKNEGFFAVGDETLDNVPSETSSVVKLPLTRINRWIHNINLDMDMPYVIYKNTYGKTNALCIYPHSKQYPSDLQCTAIMNAANTNVIIIAASSVNFGTTSIYGVNINTGLYESISAGSSPYSITLNGKTAYVFAQPDAIDSSGLESFITLADYNPENYYSGISSNVLYIGWALLYGNFTSESGKDGVTNQPDSSIPSTSNWTTPQTTLDDLKTQYPDLWDNAIYQDLPQEDDTTKRIVYVPMPITNNPATDTKPTNEEQTQDDIVVTPSISPQDIIDTLLKYITQPEPDPQAQPDTDIPTDENPPDTGSGDTPVVVPPTGSASSLWAVYNPSQSEVNSFGAWLWNSDFIEQLKKLFNDPMQAIIGIHKVFVPPIISGRSTIVCGYLDSGVSSNTVGAQYSTIDCGTISLPEYFGNVFDYDPYTKVHLYIPFIGIVQLDTGDVMRGSIQVKIHGDVITGAMLAEVIIKRDASGGTIYTYSGSCIVSYPISSGSYIGAVGGVISSIASGVGLAGSLASGNVMGALGGAVSLTHSIGNIHTNVQHSGGFTGAPGAMGIKKPYLIISRPQTALASNFKHFQGYPANYTTQLQNVSGYARCVAVHVENIGIATQDEKNEIERLLKSGVLVQ